MVLQNILHFVFYSHAALQSAGPCVPSAASWPSCPSNELWSAGHWSLQRSHLTVQTASRPEILSAEKKSDYMFAGSKGQHVSQ